MIYTLETVIDWWDVATAKRRAPLIFDAVDGSGGPLGDTFGSDASIFALAFSPDGEQLAVATVHTIQLFDVATRKAIRTFAGPRVFARSFAFSQDGKLLVAGKLDGSICLWEVSSGTVLRDLPGHELAVSSVAFSPDGNLLASASTDSTILLWKVADLVQPVAKAVLTAKDMERLWTDLGDKDAARAGRAIAALTAAPVEAVDYVKGRLLPVPAVDGAFVAKLFDDLDNPKFAVRAKATAELDELAELARPALEMRLAAKPTLEMRNRISGILVKLDGFVMRPEVLRNLRAIEVLELIGTSDARQALQRVGGGASDALVTRQANEALTRLKK